MQPGVRGARFPQPGIAFLWGPPQGYYQDSATAFVASAGRITKGNSPLSSRNLHRAADRRITSEQRVILAEEYRAHIRG